MLYFSFYSNTKNHPGICNRHYHFPQKKKTSLSFISIIRFFQVGVRCCKWFAAVMTHFSADNVTAKKWLKVYYDFEKYQRKICYKDRAMNSFFNFFFFNFPAHCVHCYNRIFVRSVKSLVHVHCVLVLLDLFSTVTQILFGKCITTNMLYRRKKHMKNHVDFATRNRCTGLKNCSTCYSVRLNRYCVFKFIFNLAHRDGWITIARCYTFKTNGRRKKKFKN